MCSLIQGCYTIMSMPCISLKKFYSCKTILGGWLIPKLLAWLASHRPYSGSIFTNKIFIVKSAPFELKGLCPGTIRGIGECAVWVVSIHNTFVCVQSIKWVLSRLTRMASKDPLDWTQKLLERRAQQGELHAASFTGHSGPYKRTMDAAVSAMIAPLLPAVYQILMLICVPCWWQR